MCLTGVDCVFRVIVFIVFIVVYLLYTRSKFNANRRGKEGLKSHRDEKCNARTARSGAGGEEPATATAAVHHPGSELRLRYE